MEIIIIDNEILKDNLGNELYGIVEDAFLLCEHNIQIQLQFGSFYFAHRTNGASYMHNPNIKNIYLLNCVYELESTSQVCNTSNLISAKINYENFDSIYWIQSSVPNDFIEGACSSLLNNAVRINNSSYSGENTLFIFRLWYA